MKGLKFHPGALKDIKRFPKKVRARIAGLLDMVCAGIELPPKDFKYMKSVGEGVYEMRIRVNTQYRVFYVAKFESSVYVLHAFVKKTQQTRKHDIEVGEKRYQQLLRELESDYG